MDSSAQQNETSNVPEHEDDVWEPQAWVYILWVAMGNRVFCKIGYSADPSSRLGQIIGGIPEQPFRIYLLPCLTIEQAKVFESMLHSHLQKYRTKGEWFSHTNAKHLYRIIGAEVRALIVVFRTFGYENDLRQIDLDGKRPVLYDNGLIFYIE